MRLKVAAFAALVTLLVSTPLQAFAAASKGGIVISPAFQDISISHDQPEKTFVFSVTNNDPIQQEMRLSAVDFGSLDETGGILFVGPEKALSYKYGLAKWITLEKDVVELQPHETQKVTITIDNKESLAPGGHYGAILVTPTLDTTQDTSKLQINEVASSLIFLTKEGGQIYSMKLNSSHLNGSLFKLPGTITAKFQNTGNVHVIPRGLVTITDPLGRVVKQGAINSDSGLALPESFREIISPIDSLDSAWLPGVYHAKLTYYYEGQAQQTTLNSSFVYVNGWYLVLLALLIVVAIYVVHNRKKLQKRLVGLKRSILPKKSHANTSK